MVGRVSLAEVGLQGHLGADIQSTLQRRFQNTNQTLHIGLAHVQTLAGQRMRLSSSSGYPPASSGLSLSLKSWSLQATSSATISGFEAATLIKYSSSSTGSFTAAFTIARNLSSSSFIKMSEFSGVVDHTSVVQLSGSGNRATGPVGRNRCQPVGCLNSPSLNFMVATIPQRLYIHPRLSICANLRAGELNPSQPTNNRVWIDSPFDSCKTGHPIFSSA
ncbi:hypothetical protein OGAPHI_005133 [Ogataea philodendri]|uniref:Uncharacterized protein n=1 Tax=Ogataea philodendri TaxID=1378263 RepID=A0A9P8P2C9_9ASCO|nr:uncharacterized protein OGAPHI_005133 [Ogataea philodendri]KAH3663731.1 hypothetical protein OGAPHI_005133 [Ogataea philodendri]